MPSLDEWAQKDPKGIFAHNEYNQRQEGKTQENPRVCKSSITVLLGRAGNLLQF